MSPLSDPIDALRTFPLDGAPPRYEAGWFARRDERGKRHFEAFLRPHSEDWYDLFGCPNWWHAQAKALELAQITPDCEYIGGPPWGQA